MHKTQAGALAGGGYHNGRAGQRGGTVIGIASFHHDSGAVYSRPSLRRTVLRSSYLPIPPRRRPTPPTTFEALETHERILVGYEFHVVHEPSGGRCRTVGEEIEFNLDALPRIL